MAALLPRDVGKRMENALILLGRGLFRTAAEHRLGSITVADTGPARQLLAKPEMQNEAPMDDHAPKTDVKTRARRKLIRGAFSVPALLAVHNGSALAASTSARMRAVLNALPDGGGETPSECDSRGDGWTRVPIHKHTYYDSGQRKNVTKHYVKVSELAAIATARDLPFVKPSTGPNGIVTDYVEYVTSGQYHYAAPANNASGMTRSDRLAAVLFEKQGTSNAQVRLARFVQKDEGSAPVRSGAVTESAWASFQAWSN